MSDDRNNDSVKAVSTGDSEAWRRALRANSADARSFSQAQWSDTKPSAPPPLSSSAETNLPSTTPQTVAGTASVPSRMPAPPANANSMPGGTQHTAGGKASDVTLGDAAKTITKDDWLVFHKKPCVKDSFLVGIGSGFAAGSLRAIWRGKLQETKPPKAHEGAVM